MNDDGGNAVVFARALCRDGDGVGGSHLACGRGSGGNVRSRDVGGGRGARPLDRSSGRDGAAGKRGGGDRDVGVGGSYARRSGSSRHVRGSWGSGDVGRSTGRVLLLDDDLFLDVGVLATGVGVGVVVVVVTVRVDGVSYAFGNLVGDLVCSVVGGVTERMVLTFVVVISHRQAVTLGGLGGGTGR